MTLVGVCLKAKNTHLYVDCRSCWSLQMLPPVHTGPKKTLRCCNSNVRYGGQSLQSLFCSNVTLLEYELINQESIFQTLLAFVFLSLYSISAKKTLPKKIREFCTKKTGFHLHSNSTRRRSFHCQHGQEELSQHQKRFQ